MNIPAIPWAKLWAWLKPLLAKLVADKARDVLGEPQERFFLTRWVTWARNKISGNLYLLTAGMSDFHGKANFLPECQKEAEAMAKLYRSFGATVVERKNIGLGQFWNDYDDALSQLGDGKTVVVHLSSHGTPIGDRSGDEADGKDECVVFSDMGLASDDEIFAKADEAIRKRGGNLILVFDVCFGGGMARGTEMADEPAFASARFIPESELPEASVAQYLAHKQHFPVDRATEFPRHTVMMATQENNYAYDGVYSPSYIRAAERGNAKAYDLHLAIKSDLVRRNARQIPQFAGEATAKIFG